MSVLVIDSSITLAWILLELEFKERVDRAIERLTDTGGVVPYLWHYEVRNGIVVAERRGRISQFNGDSRLKQWSRLPIETDASPDFDTVMSLARRYGLSYYDALFVELAIRRDAQLATLDGAMAHAAAAEGVPVT